MALPGEKMEREPASPRSPVHPVSQQGAPAGTSDAGGPTLGFYLEAVSEGRWVVLACLAIAGLVLAWILGTQTPIYEADVVLQIEDRRQSGSLGIATLDGPQGGMGAQFQVGTEIEVMQSRKLLGTVVDELHLDVGAAPRYFPKFGRPIAIYRDGKTVARPILGKAEYAWGGERIRVTRFDVPPELDNASIVVTLVSLGDGKFNLLNGGREFLASGEVGKPVTWTLKAQGEEGPATVFVQELRSNPGTEFQVWKNSRAHAASALGRALKFGEKGKFTGLIRVSMASSDPRHAVSVLNVLAEAYLRQSVEKRSAEAERTLKFLETQIPILRANLEAAETALERYRASEGRAGVDLSLATSSTLQRSIEIERRLSEMELQRMEMLYRFTPTHPAVQALNEKVAQLRAERERVDSDISQLPEAESASVRLKRDVSVASGLYLALLNRSQELQITKSGMLGNVRILDTAVLPAGPVDAKRGQTAGIALAVGLLGGVLLAIGRKALHQGLRDPAEAERLTGLPVRASIPHSARQVGLEKERNARRDGRHPVLAAEDPTDMAAESLRSLRTSLQFALMDAPNQVIAVGGPRPGVGKSFVTVNLARVFADAGKSVLLLDADLRKGSLHGYLGIHRTPGLAEAIAGTVSIGDVLHKTDLPGIDFVPRGSSPSNPSELLGSERFRDMVAGLARGYDMVLIDLPPVLAVTDAALVGRVAGVNLLVLRSGWHPIREVQLAVKAYAENGVRLSGLIFNDVPQGKGGPGGYAYQYQYQYHYQYSYKPKDEK